MPSSARRTSASGAEAAAATARRRRRLVWAFGLVWASDFVFDWTGLLGLEALGFWLWLLGLVFLVYRSVVGTKLPEGLLTWAWMLGGLAMWIIGVWVIGALALDGATSDPSLFEELGAAPGGTGSRQFDAMAVVLLTTMIASMAGWGAGTYQVLLGVVLSVAFAIRRRLPEHREANPLPALLPRERGAHVILVVLQAPLFALLLVASGVLLGAGTTLWQGADSVGGDIVGTISGTVALAGLGCFVLGVLQLRQLLTLRFCGRAGLVVAGLTSLAVLGAVTLAAVYGHPIGWVLVVVALLWVVAQLSAARILWPVRTRQLTSSRPML